MMGSFFSNTLRGIYLGVLSCSWLGFLIGLRILNWNPMLWNEFSNIAGALFHITLLYVILGLFAGIPFTLGLNIVYTIFHRERNPSHFARFWMIVFSVIIVVFFILLSFNRTHPEAHVVIYDIPLVIVYLATLLIGYLITDRLIGRTNKGIFKVSLVTAAAFSALGLVISYAATPKIPPPVKGDPEEIAEALISADKGAKVFVYGLDGAEWTLIDSLISEGMMPVTDSLIKNGVRARFRSLDCLKSPLIWTSMATGKVPEKHGIEDFGSFRFPWMKQNFIKYPDGIGYYRLVSTFMPSASMPVSSTLRRAEAIWNILSKADISVGLVGWWATWPVEEVNGFMVSDRLTYAAWNPKAESEAYVAGQVYPSGLFPQIAEFIRPAESMSEEEIARFVTGDISLSQYPSDWDDVDYRDWNPFNQLKRGYTNCETFFHTSINLIDRRQPDFFSVYFDGLDKVSHFFWQYMDPSVYPDPVSPEDMDRFGEVIPRFYCYCDSLLGEMVKHLDPSTDIIVVSDHGFGPNPKPHVPFRGGDHLINGVFYASGPHFKRGFVADDGSVLDLTPTLLYLFGMPSGKDMDGKVMEDIFVEEFRANHPIEYIESYETGRILSAGTASSEVDEKIKEQLRALGYTK